MKFMFITTVMTWGSAENRFLVYFIAITVCNELA